jgi:hypothetical protein
MDQAPVTGVAATAEHWYIGETLMRFSSVRLRSTNGESSLLIEFAR